MRWSTLTLNPRLPTVPPPLRIFFQAAKTLVSATKWLQLIVGSSFAVILARRRWTWRHRQFWIPVQFNGKPNFNYEECKIIWEFQIRWGGISHLKPLRRYFRYFRGTHWRSSLSHRLLAFYTWMSRVTDCLYAAQCRSRGIGEWLKWLSAVMSGHVLHRLILAKRNWPPYLGLE